MKYLIGRVSGLFAGAIWRRWGIRADPRRLETALASLFDPSFFFLTVSFPCGFLSYLVVICCCLTIFRYAFVNQYLSFFELFLPLLLLCFYSHFIRLCRVLLIDLSISVGAIDLVLTCNLTWTQVFPLFSYFLY